ncbi:uncharacterized protein LOC115891845 [Sitophilus oryzae]|uniref:Uncharacterized protein LOC115891845 n=1 Tax=Sitophilus oryzae TaxID=7048 RepID=A0A6J2YYI0_SITOR|nr:uncharacterized protein LOC115891845 [Sitophilus oryzae]
MLGKRLQVFTIGIFFIFTENLYANISKNTEISLFLKDFLKQHVRSDKLATYTCWGKETEISFKKTLQDEILHSSVSEKSLDKLIYSDNIFLDASCTKTQLILQKIEELNLFTPSQYWMILKTGSDLDDFLQNIYFPITSNVYFLDQNYYGFSIKKVYSPSSKIQYLNQSFVGYWTLDNGYVEIIGKFDQNKDRKFIDTDITVSYVVEDQETLTHLDDYRYKILIDSVTKYNYAVLQHLYYLLNASKVELFRDTLYSKDIDGKHVIGMVEDLKSGICEIGGNPIEFLSNTVDEFDFVAHTRKMEKKFIFRATPHSYISNVFTLPFDTYVWYSCFGLMVAIFLVAYLVVYWEWKDPVFRKYLIPRFALRPDPVDIFLMEVGSAAQQGFESEPRSNAGRIVFIFTLISLMFLYTSFSANIVALLQSTTERLNTLEHLLDSRIPVGFEQNVSMKYFEDINFDKKTKDFYNKIYKPVFYGIEEGVKKIKEEFFGFYADTTSVYKYISDSFLENEKCGLREIPFKNSYVDYWLVARKNTSLIDLYRSGMQKIHEVGLRSREHHRIFTGKPKCDSEGGNFESVGLADSYGAFLFMGVGIGLSLFLFLIELAWQKYFKMKREEILNFIDDEEGRESYREEDELEDGPNEQQQHFDFAI